MASQPGVTRRIPRRPVALGRRSVDPGEEAGVRARRLCRAPEELGFERAGHPDAVLVHAEALVVLRIGEGLLRHQVVLVRGEHHPPPEALQEHLLPLVDGMHHRAGLVDRVQAHRGLGVVAAEPERHHGDGLEFRVLVEHTGHGALEHVAVVHARAEHDLATNRDAVVEQRPQPPQAHPATGVLEHPVAHLVVGRVDADVQRREAFGDDTLEVGFGEAGQGREVAVQEREAVVVVLEVQAAAQPLRQLVDEAELTVVVAGADPIEHRARHLGPERLTGSFLHLDRQLQTAAQDVEGDLRVVGGEAPFDDVAGHGAVQSGHHVADLQTGVRGRRTGRDSDNSGRRHAQHATGAPTTLPVACGA